MQNQRSTTADGADAGGQLSGDAQPKIDTIKEIRLAIVMYGGSSLCVYINGIAQELLWLVKATASKRRTGDGSRDTLLAHDELAGSARVYRKLGQYLGQHGKRIDQIATTDTIRTRFVIDILSGSSAGGINAIFLSKALANMQEIDTLKRLWVEEGDISVLINDKQSMRGLPKLPFQSPPRSLLNGQRMYWQLLSAFVGMDGDIAPHPSPDPPSCESVFVEQLDLYVTTTDLGGVMLPIKLADAVIYESRHRNVFHFVYATEDASGEDRNDFQAAFNPFLAFAARCTSSLPLVFEPMTLGSTDRSVQSFDLFRGDYEAGPDSTRWKRFYKDYEGSLSFQERAFGDGGALDNKPFSYPTETLLRRRADLPVDRKLLYVEPDPTDNRPGAEPLPPPDAVVNLWKQVHSLPRTETIREDVQRILDRNRQIQRINGVLNPLQRDLAARGGSEVGPLTKGRFASRFLDRGDKPGLVEDYGAGYGGYQRLRVGVTTEDLAELISRVAGLKEDSDEVLGVRYVVRAWRDRHYSHFARDPQGQLIEGKEPFSGFLVDFDLTFTLRRLSYLQQRANDLFDEAEEVNKRFTESRVQFSLDGGGLDVFRGEVARARSSLAEAFTRLRKAGRQLRSPKDEVNPLLDKRDEKLLKAWGAIRETIKPEDLVNLLAIPTEKKRQDAADALEAQLDGHFQTIAERLAEGLGGAEKDVEMGPLAWRPPAREDLAKGRPPASATDAIHQYLAHYFDYFVQYDIVAFPMMYGTDIGEADFVDVIRVSPLDARSLIDVAKEPDRKKVGGAELGHFGAFLDRLWRENDILWGRLDGAERLIEALVPASDEDRDEIVHELVEEAHLAIISEELRPSDREELVGLLADALARIAPGDRNTEELEKLIQAPAGSPINPRLQEVLRQCLTEKELLSFYDERYSLDADLPPGPLLNSAGRITHVAGQVFGDVASAHGIKPMVKPIAWVARAGRLLAGMVEAAVPGRLPHMLYRHWLTLAYVFEVLLIVLGAVFHVGSFLSFGWTALAVTVLFSLVMVALSSIVRGRPVLGVVGPLLLVFVAIALVGMVVFEIRHLGQDLTPFKGKSWELPGLFPFESYVRDHPLRLIPLALLAAALYGIVLWQGRSLMRKPTVPLGIVDLELAGSRTRARKILEAWGEPGQRIARVNLRLDYPFLVVYSLLLALACAWAVAAWRGGWNVAAWIGFFVAWGQLLAGVLDGVEDWALLRLLSRSNPNESLPLLARRCAQAKFALVTIGAVYVLSGVIRFVYVHH
jgi:patatin-related protein